MEENAKFETSEDNDPLNDSNPNANGSGFGANSSFIEHSQSMISSINDHSELNPWLIESPLIEISPLIQQ